MAVLPSLFEGMVVPDLFVAVFLAVWPESDVQCKGSFSHRRALGFYIPDRLNDESEGCTLGRPSFTCHSGHKIGKAFVHMVFDNLYM